jgi:MFS transporter, putative metabolite transport protein
VPWFLQDLGTYGIGIFTPTILAASIGHKTAHVRSLADLINNDVLAAKGAALIGLLLIVGIVCAVLLADKIGPDPAAGLWLHRVRRRPPVGVVFGQRYRRGSDGLYRSRLHAVQFHDKSRPQCPDLPSGGRGLSHTDPRHGRRIFAAAFAKIGAVMTAFLFPILLADIGTQALLYILVATSLIGAAVTRWFRIETTGVNLEKIGQ